MQPDPYACWCCGAQGAGAGIIRRCFTCDVTWWWREIPSGPLRRDVVVWGTETLRVVDFTKPGALSCPA